jgi:UPF0148 protein
MTETDENRKLQMITRLLEKGGTMLANHHDCGAPMFRYQGKVLCPVCDFQEGVPEKRPEIKMDQVLYTSKMQEKNISEKSPQRPPSFNQIDIVIKNKIQNMAQSLENETDLARVKEKMECIELGIRILKLLQ